MFGCFSGGMGARTGGFSEDHPILSFVLFLLLLIMTFGIGFLLAFLLEPCGGFQCVN